MAKNIIFCSDGTWNHPKEQDAHKKQDRDTNIAKLRALFDQSPSQVMIYDDGVGVHFPEFLGGALGVGLFGKIKQAYATVAAQYEPGDRLFLFGFSRGAYTARAFAGMLSLIGLPTKWPTGDRTQAAKTAAEKAFDAYSLVLERKGRLEDLKDYALEIPTIQMQGMWDTVGSLGFTGALFGLKDPAVYGFLDTDLHANTKSAFHAISIDEQRSEFKLVPWNAPVAPEQVVKQVWFAGVHSEVGGSAEAVGLSDITLGWMLLNAEAQGAILAPGAKEYLSIDPWKTLDVTRDSWSFLWGIPKHRDIPSGATIANSVAVRLSRAPDYHPRNLSFDPKGSLSTSYATEDVVGPLSLEAGMPIPSNDSKVDTGFDIVEGKQYRLIADGTWIDKNPPPVDAAGIDNPGGIRDKMDGLKQMPSAPWMALLGRVDKGPWFVIGRDTSPRSLPAGRLYCCANDVPFFYRNNHGSLTLRIEEV